MLNSASSAFVSWSATHFVALVTILAMTGLAAAAGRLLRSGKKLRAVRLVLAGVFTVALLAEIARRFAVGVSNWADLLPMHLCDVSFIMAAVALVTLRRIPFEFAYFFGIGGTLQALLTPDIVLDFPSFGFVIFFAAHGATIVAVAFLMAGYGLRPERGAVLRMVIAGNLYLAMAAIVNLATGTNYGYLSQKPANPSLLDHLGTWPWYILSMEVLAILTIIVLDLPFVRRRHRKSRNAAR